MSALALLRNIRMRAQLRNELDRLSPSQLRDINLERIAVVPGTSVYQHREWNGI